MRIWYGKAFHNRLNSIRVRNCGELNAEAWKKGSAEKKK
jgi:hypothetical protein